jgi:aspartokinase-like uncharacterized kinase
VSESRSEPASGPLVVKIGGGLLTAHGLDGLRRACEDVDTLSRRRPVLVIPGGGPFADAVRAVDAGGQLGDELAHRLALAAMDQLGTVLARLMPAEAIATLRAPSGLGLLLAVPAFAGRPDVPESWEVTSDSLAVLAAGAIGASEAILLKAVPGVLPRWPSLDPPIAELTAARLRELHEAGDGRAVDDYLPTAIEQTGVSVCVRAPGADAPPGTLITPG